MARFDSRKSCMKRVSRRLHKKATTKRQHQQVIGKASKACSRKMRVRVGKRRASPKRTVSPKRASVVVNPNREPSMYNTFMKDEIARLKISRPGLDHKARFRLATENWKARAEPKNPDREPSMYNMFIKSEIARLKISRPGLDHRARFRLATENWKARAQPQSPVSVSQASPQQTQMYSYEWYLNEFGKEQCSPESLARAIRSESRNLLIDLNNENEESYRNDPRRQNMIRAYNAVLSQCTGGVGNMDVAQQAVQDV